MQQIIPSTDGLVTDGIATDPNVERIGAMFTIEGDRLEVFLFDKQNTMEDCDVLRAFSIYLNDACRFAINHNLKQVQVKTKNLVCPAFDPKAVLNRGEAYRALIQNS